MSLSMHVEKQLDDFYLKINLELENETVGLLGYSGSGKTMTLKMLAGIVKPDKGRIVLNDRILFDSEKKIDLSPQKRNVGLMFQSYALFNHMTVTENIMIGMKGTKKEKKEKAAKYLKLLALEGVKDQKPCTLSGGQKQRTALARILAQEPEILLLDEPFSALDSHLIFTIEKEFMAALDSYKGTVIYISHNRHEVYKYCQQTAVMSKGEIVEIKPTSQLFNGCETVAAAQLTGCRNMARLEAVGEGMMGIPSWELQLKEEEIKAKCHYIGIREGDLWLQDKKKQLSSAPYHAVEVAVKDIFMMPDKVKVELRTKAGYKFIYTCSKREFHTLDVTLEESLMLVIDKRKLLFLQD